MTVSSRRFDDVEAATEVVHREDLYDPVSLSRHLEDCERNGATDSAHVVRARLTASLALSGLGLAGGLQASPPSLSARELQALGGRKAPEVTFVVILRNDRRSIARCVGSLPRGSQLLVVDTGSTDGSVDLVRAMRPDARVLRVPWPDDFAAVRNLGATQVRTGWVLHIDADEWLAPEAAPLISACIALLESHPARNSLALAISIHDSVARRAAPIARGYRAHGDLAFFGRVHEQLWTVDAALGAPTVVASSIVFLHDGYEPTQGRDKPARNVALLDREILRSPTEPRWRYFRARDGADLRPPLSRREDLEVAARGRAGHVSPGQDCVLAARRVLVDDCVAAEEWDRGEAYVTSWVDADPASRGSAAYFRAALARGRHTSALRAAESELARWLASGPADDENDLTGLRDAGWTLLADLALAVGQHELWVRLGRDLVRRGDPGAASAQVRRLIELLATHAD